MCDLRMLLGELDRRSKLAEQVQAVTGDAVKVAFVNQGCHWRTGGETTWFRFDVVKLPSVLSLL